MKQALNLRLSQQLTMTPQLQQAIRLLQLSHFELQQEIQSALEANPMLEANEELSEHEKPTALPNDWRPTHTASSSNAGEFDFIQNCSAQPSLRDTLFWQIDTHPFSEKETLIARTLADAIDEHGFLQTTTEEIHDQLLEEDPELEHEEVIAVLQLIQHFEPTGVGSRDLHECLHLQLKQLPDDTPYKEEALRLLQCELNLFIQHDQKVILKQAKLSHEAFLSALQLIQTLNLSPGDAIASNQADYITPDIIVKKINGQWHALLNEENLPRIKINQMYSGLIKRADNSDENVFLRDHLQEARWFLKSLQTRHETLVKVARCIVEQQEAFFEFGEEAMKPMVLQNVAEQIEMHESTVSRVTSQKYMLTPSGVFELKYFFSSQINSHDGSSYSSTAIRALIKKIIAAEDTCKPLSDNKIATLLQGQGVDIARRTVAKYREAMNIAPSKQRKRFL